MYGSIIGDIAGSIYEWNNLRTETPEIIKINNPKCYFTDDSVLTVAIAEAILSDRDYKKSLLKWANKYPRGYGYKFRAWYRSPNPKPFKSFGNGSAMRAGPVGWAFDTLEETLLEAEKTAAPTHNHREGIKGAKATAAAVYLARNGKTKAEIKDFIEKTYKYKLNVPLNRIRKHAYAGTCQRDVPAALICFLESSDFINSIQVAISVGGDTDTIACITGSIAEAFYKNIPLWAIKFAHEKLGEDMKGVIGTFYEKYIKKYGLVYGIPDEVDMLV